MRLAYVDESGDTGAVANGGSRTFTLGCVLVRASQWPAVFDQLIAFRRFIKVRFGVPVRAEIKANYLLRNGGPFRDLGLGEQARAAIYRLHLRLQPKLGIHTMAVVIDKTKLAPGVDPHERAWTYLFQRLERLAHTDRDTVVVVHDEGEPKAIRRLARKARRAGAAGSMFGTGALPRPFVGLVDDPVERNSRESYLLQLADLNAYAAFRATVPAKSARTVSIVPSWDELGAARYGLANRLAGGPPGIVLWPK